MLLLIICFISFLQFAAAMPTVTSADSVSNVNKKYVFQYYVQANWYNAYLFCRDNGMQLATINSQAEQDYLSKLIEDIGLAERWWISGTDLGQENRFSWLPTGKLLKYTNWDGNQPDNEGGIEHCVELRPNKTWNDWKCFQLLPFICETDSTQAEVIDI